jgi:hypothetical protein
VALLIEPERPSWRASRYAANGETDLLIQSGTYIDWLVWALTELMLGYTPGANFLEWMRQEVEKLNKGEGQRRAPASLAPTTKIVRNL